MDIFGREPLQDSSLQQDGPYNQLFGRAKDSKLDNQDQVHPIQIGSYLPSNNDLEEESEKFYYSEDVLAFQRYSDIVQMMDPNRIVPQSYPEILLKKEIDETIEIRDGLPVASTTKKGTETGNQRQMLAPMNSEASNFLRSAHDT